jgi:hypothetical protein
VGEGGGSMRSSEYAANILVEGYGEHAPQNILKITSPGIEVNFQLFPTIIFLE